MTPENTSGLRPDPPPHVRAHPRAFLTRPSHGVARIRPGWSTPCPVVRPVPEGSSRASWRGWREGVRVVTLAVHLKKTGLTALIVGSVLFAINQLNVVLDGHARPEVWIKAGVTYLVPFVVSNVGILIATRRRE